MRHVHSRVCFRVANEQCRRSRTSVRVLRLILLLCASSPSLAVAGERYDFRYFEGRNGHRIVEARDMARNAGRRCLGGHLGGRCSSDSQHRLQALHIPERLDNKLVPRHRTCRRRNGLGTRQGNHSHHVRAVGETADDERNEGVARQRFSSHALLERRSCAGCHG